MFQSTRESYNLWSSQYDSNINRTRDLEAVALRKTLEGQSFNNCLEIGCGTGKNTEWLLHIAKKITAADGSPAMLSKAREKVTSPVVDFVEADILASWDFATGPYDLAVFSLVLEHIEQLDPVFNNLAKIMTPGGRIYIGELHPFKQYTGSKARFETATGIQVVDCYTHHISDFIATAKKHGFELSLLEEYFDEDDRSIPRLLILMLKKFVVRPL